jgi:hypothetical protein
MSAPPAFEKIMDIGAAIAVFVLTIWVATARMDAPFSGALVVAFLLAALVYACVGWERERQRNRRRD